MIIIDSLTIRNFFSVGNVPQTVTFNNETITLILGENLDLGGADNRNGVGKSTLIQAISYALYGSPISNVRKDNMINRTNGKNMMVTIDFSVDGKQYRIERGRKPNVLRLFIDSAQQVTTEQSDSQGENKETQAEIERILNMSHDMFRNIVVLNTYTTPFLEMKAADQRVIIEQLLGITLLSEKADKLKEAAKAVKDKIQLEEYRLRAITESNRKVQDHIDSLVARQQKWDSEHDAEVMRLTSQLESIGVLDVEEEIAKHAEVARCKELTEQHNAYNAILTKHRNWENVHKAKISKAERELVDLNGIDIEAEVRNHTLLREYNDTLKSITSLKSAESRLSSAIRKDQATVAKLESEIATIQQNKCYACGQDIHDDGHADLLASKQEILGQTVDELAQNQKEHQKIKNEMEILESGLGTKPIVAFSSVEQALSVREEIKRLASTLETLLAEVNPYEGELSNAVAPTEDIPVAPRTYYPTLSEVYEHRARVDRLIELLEKKAAEVNPYTEQLEEMRQSALQEVTYDVLNELSREQDHHKFLIDLLTNRDSFLRKKIIDQNLSYLNTRLSYYLERIGLPHQVVFQNDLSVEITELGRELDFHNLSRGEMNRLTLSLSWAFRDVWESMYSPVNVMFIDELLDNGTDSAGVEASLGVLKELNRSRKMSIWLISHKDDLSSRVSNVLKVIKENGFTRFSDQSE